MIAIEINTMIFSHFNNSVQNLYFLKFLQIKEEKNAIDLLINKISEFKNEYEIVVFFSDSFELHLLKEIIKKLDKRFNFYCVFINLKNKDFYKKKQKYIFSKVFQNKKRNIYIAKY